jgi:hypothetical protein
MLSQKKTTQNTNIYLHHQVSSDMRVLKNIHKGLFWTEKWKIIVQFYLPVWNDGIQSPHYTAQLRKLQIILSSLWKPQISHPFYIYNELGSTLKDHEHELVVTNDKANTDKNTTTTTTTK